jgi:two-component system cell cycle sensor histidine kinase/response regulator CckA
MHSTRPSDLSPFLEAVPLGAYLLRLEDPGTEEDLRIVFANSASRDILGLEPSLVIGTLLGEHFPAALGESGIAAAYRGVIVDQRPNDLGIVSYGDIGLEQQRFAVAAYPVGPDSAVMLFENLSAGPGRSNELAAIVDFADDAILSKDLEGTILTWNDAAERIYGYSAAEAIGRSISMLVPPDRPDEITGILDRLRRGERVAHFETQRVRKDGTVIDVSLTVSPLIDANTRVVGAAMIARDIGVYKEDEARLRRFEAIVEASEDAIVSRTIDGVITTWNGGAERLFGYTANEMIGTLVNDATPESPFDGGADLGKLRSGVRPRPFETRMLRKDGTRADVSVATSPIADRTGQVIGVARVIRDMTEQRLLEEQLAQSQKLEAIGSLAGGVAHDFNNVLTIIRVTCEVVLKNLSDEALRQKMEQIDRAAEHAASLTRQLLAFSRQQVLQPEPTDLNNVVEATLELADRLIGAPITLTRHLGTGLKPVHVDRSQLQQVILNLCINARDAMPQGGTISIRTSNVVLDEVDASVHLEATPGAYVLLEVTDTGVGMDDEISSRIFDPFFTTKGSEGTGLGLATVHGIVRQSGGHLSFDSEPGLGTAFRVFLPVATGSVLPAPPVLVADESFEGSETILVVEDNDVLRPMIAEMIGPYGYTVLVAADGVEALLVAAQHHGNIDLLLTDVVMPRLNGRELSERLLKTNPGVKILFSSGYPADTVIRSRIAETRLAFIQKPYVAAELLSKIRAMLAAPQ